MKGKKGNSNKIYPPGTIVSGQSTDDLLYIVLGIRGHALDGRPKYNIWLVRENNQNIFGPDWDLIDKFRKILYEPGESS